MIRIVKERVWGDTCYYLKLPSGKHVCEVNEEIAHSLAKGESIKSNFKPDEKAVPRTLSLRADDGKFYLHVKGDEAISERVLADLTLDEVINNSLYKWMTLPSGETPSAEYIMLMHVLSEMRRLSERLERIENKLQYPSREPVNDYYQDMEY